MAESIQKSSCPERCNSSMQLTRGADYAVRVMMHLATLPEDKRALLHELADAAEVPESFLSKVLQALAHAELISSRRGKTGGFAILPRGRQASMREVIEAVDGPIALNICLNGTIGCERRSSCPAHPVWARAQRAMLDVLMGISVTEMAARLPANTSIRPGR
jgi:Rrf2 family protein